MGYQLHKYKTVQLRTQDQQKQVEKEQTSNKTNAQIILEKFHDDIERLPARNNLKRLLKKCVVGLFLGEKIEGEIIFLNDLRKLLNRVRDNKTDEYYVDLLEILEDIYILAVDKQFENAFQVDPTNKQTEQILKALQESEPYRPYYYYYDYYDEMGYYYAPENDQQYQNNVDSYEDNEYYDNEYEETDYNSNINNDRQQYYRYYEDTEYNEDDYYDNEYQYYEEQNTEGDSRGNMMSQYNLNSNYDPEENISYNDLMTDGSNDVNERSDSASNFNFWNQRQRYFYVNTGNGTGGYYPFQEYGDAYLERPLPFTNLSQQNQISSPNLSRFTHNTNTNLENNSFEEYQQQEEIKNEEADEEQNEEQEYQLQHYQIENEPSQYNRFQNELQTITEQSENEDEEDQQQSDQNQQNHLDGFYLNDIQDIYKENIVQFTQMNENNCQESYKDDKQLEKSSEKN